MKRYLVVLVVLALAALTAAVWAAQGQPGQGAADGQWGDRGGGMMMGQAAVAVSGNYVYVVSRGQLLQFDTSLNLVRQAELPMPERGRGGGGGMGMGRGGGGGM